jgi:membrane protein
MTDMSNGQKQTRAGRETPIVSLLHRVAAILRRLDDLSGGRLGIIKDAIDSFTEARGSEAAAGMAYYAIFSLFPLLLALVAIGSLVLDRQQVMNQVVSLVSQVFPISRGLIQENLQQVIRLRGAVGLISLAGAVWSATGVFTVLNRNINRAWTDAKPRNLLQSRLLALGMVSALLLLLGLSVASTAASKVLSQYQVPLGGGVSIYQTPLWTIGTIAVPWLFVFLLFLSVYRWVPNEHVPWSAAAWAALIVAVIWQIGARAFAWYVGSGLARYQVVYGSLGAVVALMAWIYLGSWLTFFGAHLGAAVARYQKAGAKGQD